MKITVAIPIYNAERHLNVTLDSLINQTMDSSEFEVICVNDVSTDNSARVVESYIESNHNIKLINREINSGGPMLPRNDAIQAAKGEYILFLDNDDFLGEETLERFYKNAKEYNSDVIFGKYIGVNGRPVPKSMFKFGNLPNAEIIEHNLVHTLAPHKMFKLEMIRENNIRFHKEAVVGEDQLFVMQCFIKANTITVLSDYNYYYVVKRGSENLSVKYFPAKNFYYSFNLIMESIEKADFKPLYKTKLAAAFLHRFLLSSRLRKYILTDRLKRNEKDDWFTKTKKFFDNHVNEELLHLLPTKYQYFVQIVRENDLEKLLMVHEQMKHVNPNHISRVEDGSIYANFNYYNKYLAYEQEFKVNHLNTSNVFLDKIILDETHCELTGQFYQSLLINMDVINELVLVHRETGIEKRIKNDLHTGSGQFRFYFDYREIVIDKNSVGAWDFFIEGSIGGYTKRRRLGKDRSVDLINRKLLEENEPSDQDSKKENGYKKKIIIDSVYSFGQNYQVKAYFTVKQDNLSFDVQLGK